MLLFAIVEDLNLPVSVNKDAAYFVTQLDPLLSG